MGKILISFAFLAFILAPSRSEDLPQYFLSGLVQAGVPTMVDLIERDQRNYNDSVDAFKPVNETCNQIVEAKTQQCVDCVEAACTARAEDVCAPTGFAKFLYDSKMFFENGLPNFFTASLPNFVTGGAGGAFISLGSETGNFFSNGGFESGMQNFGNILNHGNWATSIGNIGNIDFNGVLNSIGSGLVNVGNSIWKGITGRRRRDLYEVLTNVHRARRSAEPSCDALTNNASLACMYYVSTCSDCDIQKTRDCPGYEAALENVMTAMNEMNWLTKFKESNYLITRISFNPADRNAITGVISKAMVTANVFGNLISFEVDNINPYDPSQGGPAIATAARGALNAPAK